MPLASVDTSAGHADFHYTISTPHEADAPAVDASLPTLLFLHSVMTDARVFQIQFQDRDVRRFNCVGLDLRDHGATKNDVIPQGYGGVQAAEDVAAFMDAINLPACHLVGASMGTVHATFLAMLHPAKVLSILLMSPICLEEPENVAHGRREIAVIWRTAMESDPPDQAAVLDCAFGFTELALSDATRSNTLLNALVKLLIRPAFETWSLARYDSCVRVMVDFFCDRKVLSTAELARIKVPVMLVQGSGDLLYDEAFISRFKGQLEQAGVKTDMTVVAGAPHALWMTDEVVNQTLVSFIKDVSGVLPPAPEEVVSAWDAELRAAGFDRDSDSSDGTE